MTTYKFTMENNSEHENTLNELLDLNCSYEIYYIEDDTKIFLNDVDELLDAYTYLTDEFYLESNNFDLNSTEFLKDYTEII